MNALHTLVEAGLTLRADGNRLIVAPASRLTDPLRDLIRQHKAELLETARVTRKGNPLMTPEQGDRCHAGGWDDGEIATFTTHVLTFVRRGIDASDADDLAERLVLRDREQDDRHLCLECSHLMRSGRCAAGALGHLAGADPRMQPVPTILMRCEAFAGALRP